MSVNLSLARVILHARDECLFVRKDDSQSLVEMSDPEADNRRLAQVYYVGDDGKPTQQPGPIAGRLVCLPSDPTHGEQCSRSFDVKQPSDIDAIVEWLSEEREDIAWTG